MDSLFSILFTFLNFIQRVFVVLIHISFNCTWAGILWW